MKLTCDRKSLADAFKAAASASPDRTPLPVLQNILVRANESGVAVHGTDMERSLGVLLRGCEVEEPGCCLLPSDKVGQLLRSWGDDRVMVESDGSSVHLSGLSGEFSFQSEDPARFPEPRAFDSADYHVVTSADMRRLIGRTIFTVKADSNQYAISGVLVEPVGETLRFTALDGMRGARQTVPRTEVGTPQHPKGSVSVPAKTLRLLDRCLADDDTPAHCCFTEKAAMFRTPDVQIWSALVEGRFPEIERALPSQFNHRIVVKSDALLAGCDRAAVATDDLSKAVDFRFCAGELSISGRTETGRSRVRVPVSYDGPEIQVRFDPNRLAPALKALGDSCDVAIEIEAPKSNLVFRADDGTFMLMISPRDDR